MKETGPDAVPPPAIFSRLERIVDRLLPAPEPNLKSIASVGEVHDAGHGVLDRVDEAVVDGDVVREVFARLGLDVVHRLDSQVLDRDDLLFADVGHRLEVAQPERLEKARSLVLRDKPDELGEARPLGPVADLHLEQVVAVRARLAEASRVDADGIQQELDVLGPAR
jgi:hypothetical protein